MKQRRKFSFNRWSWVLVLFLSLGYYGCLPSVEEACTSEFPEFNHQVEIAVAKLNPGLPFEQNRALASASVTASSPLTEDDKDRWESWAEKWLKEAQYAMDIASTRPRVRRELSELADELVAFHGYTQLGRVDRMNASLAKVQDHLARTRKLACQPRVRIEADLRGAVVSH